MQAEGRVSRSLCSMDHSLVRCRLRGGGVSRSLCSMDHSLVRCRLRGGGVVGLSVAWITAWLDAG